MKRLRLGFGILVVLGLAPASFADITDYMLNINGTTYCPSYTGILGLCSSTGGFAAAPGTVSTLDTSAGGTGLGAVTVTFNPGPGTYDVNLWLFEQLLQPGDNEYGVINGSAAAGETYQIDTPDYDAAGDPNTSAQGTIIANTAASTLANANYVPGQTQVNYGTPTCTTTADGGPTCDDFTSLGLGFNFTLGANQEEQITFIVTSANPGGFNLQQIHPADDPSLSGNAEVDAYFSGAATALSTVAGPVPEPGSVILLATMAGILLWAFRSRIAAAKAK